MGKTNHIDPDDIEQTLTLSWQHRDRFSAIVQCLYEDQVRHSASGVAAKRQKAERLKEDEHLLAENDKVNEEVAKQRKIRLKNERLEEENLAKEQLRLKDKEEREAQRELENYIKEESEALENRIREENLEKAIEAALDNPVDHEFAIDVQGHIYRGRTLKCNDVPKENRQKIPRPLKDHEKLLKQRN